MIKYNTIQKMSSLMSFIRNMFSSNTETPNQNLILTKDDCVVLNPSSEEIMKRECDVSDVMHPLNPLNIKCGSNFGIPMMCFTY